MAEEQPQLTSQDIFKDFVYKKDELRATNRDAMPYIDGTDYNTYIQYEMGGRVKAWIMRNIVIIFFVSIFLAAIAKSYFSKKVAPVFIVMLFVFVYYWVFKVYVMG